MIRFPLRRAALATSVVGLLLLVFCSSLAAQSETKGQRIYFSGHSFHFFVPPILADIAKKAGIKDHTPLGMSAIGGSRVAQHWAPAQTTTPKTATDIVLPADAITVASTARFPAAGELTVETSEGNVVVTYTGKTATTFTGCKGGKGTLTALKKVSSATNEAREALKSGKVDVFTMAPIFLPDDGIENFVKLAIEYNPKIRIFVQEFWLPWDHYDPAFKAPKDKVDHNAQTVESLRKSHGIYFKAMDEHVAELNKKYNTTAVRVAPVGQAVLKLREKVIAGDAPGLKDQNDLFSDPIGHAKAPLQALVAYCYYGLIYERSPVGLPVPAVLANAKESDKLNKLLQEIAWEAVTSHPQSGVKASNR
jgi:hypothetical protein